LKEGWQETIEEMIRLEVNEAIDSWRKDAYLTFSDFDGTEPLMIEMRIPEFDDGFIEDVIKPRRALVYLIREEIQLIGLSDSRATDEALLAHTEPHLHPTEQRKLKFFQDMLRLVLAFDAARAEEPAE
jgi:hypothetical protein